MLPLISNKNVEILPLWDFTAAESQLKAISELQVS